MIESSWDKRVLNKKLVKMDHMKKGWKNLVTICIPIMLMVSMFVVTVSANGETTMSVLCNSVVGKGDTFIVSIFCTPGQAMKSFEFSLSFDETLLQATSVSEGNIFDGYSTFFNNGTIDNENGQITSVYDLIVGSGNVTGSGYLVNISFTALEVSGTSALNLVDAGVTNETAYLPLSVSNGSVQIDASSPSITDNSPSMGSTGDSFTFNVSVSDGVDESEDIVTKVDWSHDGSSGNESMVFTGDSYFEKTVTLDASTSDMTYTIYAEDSYGNTVTTAPATVSVSDNDNPSLSSDTSSAVGTTGDTFTWYVNASDNVDSEAGLKVDVDWSHGSFSENASLSYTGSYWMYSAALDHSVSTMTYSIYIEDSAGNSIFVSGSQSPVSVSDNDVPSMSNLGASPSSQSKNGLVNLSCDVTDNIEVSSVYINVTYPDSSSVNFSVFENKSAETFYCLDSFSMIGVYSFEFYASDGAGNGVVSDSSSFTITDDSCPVISAVSLDSSSPLDTDPSFGWINISCVVTDDELNLVQLNYTDRNGVVSNVSMSQAAGSGFYYNTTFESYGNYTYYIWTNDSSGNDNVSSEYLFSMTPNWDINNDGNVTVFDFTLISNHYLETGNAGWIREDVDNNGEITVLDIVQCSNHYNEGWW